MIESSHLGHTMILKRLPRQNEISPNALRLKVLKNQQDNLERNSAALLRSLNSIFKHEDLKVFVDSIQKQTQEDKIKFTEKMLVIRKSLDNLDKKTIADDEDVEPLKEFLLEITDNIASLKQANSDVLKNLTEEEKKHQQDLNGLERRIDDFIQSHLDIRTPMRKPAAPPRHMIPGKASTGASVFDRLLVTQGGHTGGWDEQDHLLFLRHRAKCKGQRLADSVHAVLPDISLEAILEHEEWYKRYDTLRAQQRDCIKKWREKQKKTITEPDISRPKEKPPRVVNAAAAEETKKKILEWKSAKQREQQLEEEARLARKQAEKQAQKKKFIQAVRRRASLKPGLVTETKDGSGAAKPGSACDQELIRMFRERDQEVVAASLRRIEERNRAKAERATTKRRPSVVAERDPGRLLMPTQVWSQRLQQRHEPDAPAERTPAALTVSNLPRLRIPSWRKTVT